MDRLVGSKKESIKAEWGDLFDEVFLLLERTDIRLKLNREKRELQLLKERRRQEKRQIAEDKRRKEIEIKLAANKHNNKRTNKNKKIKQNKLYRIKFDRQVRKTDKQKSIKAFRVRKLGTFACSEEMAAKLTKISEKIDTIPRNPIPLDFFDDSYPDLEDFLDERRSEGKGFSGAK